MVCIHSIHNKPCRWEVWCPARMPSTSTNIVQLQFSSNNTTANTIAQLIKGIIRNIAKPFPNQFNPDCILDFFFAFLVVLATRNLVKNGITRISCSSSNSSSIQTVTCLNLPLNSCLELVKVLSVSLCSLHTVCFTL